MNTFLSIAVRVLVIHKIFFITSMVYVKGDLNLVGHLIKKIVIGQ